MPLNSAGICRKPGATSTTIEYVELLKQGHVLPVDCDVDAFASALKVIVRQHQFFSFENGKLTLSCDETDPLFVMVSDLIKTVVENFDTTRQNLSSIATSFGPSICHSLDPVAANVAVKHFFEAKYPHLKQIRDEESSRLSKGSANLLSDKVDQLIEGIKAKNVNINDLEYILRSYVADQNALNKLGPEETAFRCIS